MTRESSWLRHLGWSLQAAWLPFEMATRADLQLTKCDAEQPELSAEERLRCSGSQECCDGFVLQENQRHSLKDEAKRGWAFSRSSGVAVVDRMACCHRTGLPSIRGWSDPVMAFSKWMEGT